jgi:hypothetical protein
LPRLDKYFFGVNALNSNEDSLRINGNELCAGVFSKGGILGTSIALFAFDKESDGIKFFKYSNIPILEKSITVEFLFDFSCYLQYTRRQILPVKHKKGVSASWTIEALPILTTWEM